MYGEFLSRLGVNTDVLFHCSIILLAYMVILVIIEEIEKRYDTDEIIIGKNSTPSRFVVISYHLLKILSWSLIIILGFVGSGIMGVGV